MLIRREAGADAAVIRAVTAAAFAQPDRKQPDRDPPDREPPEARLVDELRASPAWIGVLSLVATEPGGEVIGHVVCSQVRVLTGYRPSVRGTFRLAEPFERT